MLSYIILDILDQDFNNTLMNTSQNLTHQENNRFDFLTSADTADFILHNETSNEESQAIINKSTAEEATNVSNNNDSLTKNMVVSRGNYKSIYKIVKIYFYYY